MYTCTHTTHTSKCTHVCTHIPPPHTALTHTYARAHTNITHSAHISTCMHAHTHTLNEFLPHLSPKGILWPASSCPGKRQKSHSCSHEALSGFPWAHSLLLQLQDQLPMRSSWLPGCQVGLFPSKTTYQPGSSLEEDQGQNGLGHLDQDHSLNIELSPGLAHGWPFSLQGLLDSSIYKSISQLGFSP